MTTEKLIAISGDAKTIKGEKRGILTGILYLAPWNLSGYMVCPKASQGCIAGCLNTAGRGIYKKTQDARIRKTKFFFENRDAFMALLVSNIEALVRKARRENMIAAMRLNGTSDIAWEKIRCVRNGRPHRNLFAAFPDIQFYDYTKVLGRNVKDIPNYHLTFSLSENNEKDAAKALQMGYNVAVVMNLRRKAPKPEAWAGMPVINGDSDDIRFMDKKGGNIIALVAKGKARFDKSGFVRDIGDPIRLI